MGLLERVERREGIPWNSPELSRLFQAAPLRSGVSVDEETALTYSVVYRCLSLVADTVAGLPCHVYRRLDRGRERVRAHWLDRVMNRAANRDMTSFSRRQVEVLHLLAWGHAYSELEIGSDFEPVGIWPLSPASSTLERKEGRLRFHANVNGSRLEIPRAKLHYVLGLSSDGVRGYGPIQLAREGIGLGLAAERYGAAFFGNAARPSGVLTSALPVSEPAYARLKADWRELYQGSDNAGKVAILEGGIDFKPLSIPPNDAQFLETRRFQVQEIARWFGVPPHMVGEVEGTPRAQIEQQSIEFLQLCILPVCRRIEAAYNLLLPDDHYLEHVVDGLLRADFLARTQGYRELRHAGVMTADEIRERENLPQLPGDQFGDQTWLPVNLAPANQWSRVMLESKAERPSSRSVLQASFAALLAAALGSSRRIAERKLEDDAGSAEPAGPLLTLNAAYPRLVEVAQRDIAAFAEAGEGFLRELGVALRPRDWLSMHVERFLVEALSRADGEALDLRQIYQEAAAGLAATYLSGESDG